MSTKFFIAPYSPAAWKSEDHTTDKPISNLRIDVNEYYKHLVGKWKDAIIHSQPSPGCLLEWSLPLETGECIGLEGCLQENRQIIEFGTGPKKSFLDFIISHRGFISNEHQLYLFNSSLWDSLELTSDTTKQDIINFTGIIS